MQSQHRPLIVTGMHRSGTSLLAGLLHESGVHMGTALLGASKGNPKGHFEDLEFLSFHRELLLENEQSPFGWTLEQQLTVSDARKLEAERLLLAHQKPGLWGFKDPRTTLFLDLWAELLPDAIFLFTYRSVAEVADSLYRRASSCDEIFFERPALAIRLWLHYNMQILHFIAHHGDRCILVESSQLARRPLAFLQIVQERFALVFERTPERFSDPRLLGRAMPGDAVIDALRKEFTDIPLVEHSLEQHAVDLAAQESEVASPLDSFSAPELEHWITLRSRERRIAKVEGEMHHVCGVLGATLEDVKDIFSRLKDLEERSESSPKRAQEN